MLSLNLPPCCHISLMYQTTRSHASCCQFCYYCNVDCVLFHNATHYTASLVPFIYVTTAKLLNITCTLVVTCMILGRLECTYHIGHNKLALTCTCRRWIMENIIFFLDLCCECNHTWDRSACSRQLRVGRPHMFKNFWFGLEDQHVPNLEELGFKVGLSF